MFLVENSKSRKRGRLRGYDVRPAGREGYDAHAWPLEEKTGNHVEIFTHQNAHTQRVAKQVPADDYTTAKLLYFAAVEGNHRTDNQAEVQGERMVGPSCMSTGRQDGTMKGSHTLWRTI